MIKTNKTRLVSFISLFLITCVLIYSCSKDDISTQKSTFPNPHTINLNTLLSTANAKALGLASNEKFLYFVFNKSIYSVQHAEFGIVAPQLVYSDSTIDPVELLVYNHTLYISDLGINQQILSLDLTNSNASPQTLVSGLSSPVGLVVYQNNLYFSEWWGGTIQKLDLSNNSANPTLIASGILRATHITENNGYLYICHEATGEISKLNLTTPGIPTSIVFSGLRTPWGITNDANSLYFTERDFNSNTSLGSASKTDLINSTSPIMSIQNQLEQPIDIELRENILYVSQYGGSITRFDN